MPKTSAVLDSTRVFSPDTPTATAPRVGAPTGRSSELDGLRGLAIALVLWHHLAETALPPIRESWLGWVRTASNLSWCGVDLFFVLSGFFIGGILIDRRDSPRLTRIFYLRRALRILPLYYVTLGCVLALHAMGVAGSFQLFPAWVYGLFLTNFALAGGHTWDWLPLSVLWSLAVEEQFYLLAPWLIRLLSPARLPWFAAGVALLAWALRLALLGWRPSGHFAAQVLMPLRMDALALGLLVAWAVRSDAARPCFVVLAARWKHFLALGLAGLAFLALQRPSAGDATLCAYGYTLLAIFFALLVAIVAEVRPPALCRALAWRPLAHLGRHSYFVYLWHAVIGVGVIQWLGGPHFRLDSPTAFGVVALAVAATWGAAAISWKFFEGPLVAWGQRQSY